jgi:hypothetical protein
VHRLFHCHLKIRIIVKTFLFLGLILEDIATIRFYSRDLTISCFSTVSSKNPPTLFLDFSPSLDFILLSRSNRTKRPYYVLTLERKLFQRIFQSEHWFLHRGDIFPFLSSLLYFSLFQSTILRLQGQTPCLYSILASSTSFLIIDVSFRLNCELLGPIDWIIKMVRRARVLRVITDYLVHSRSLWILELFLLCLKRFTWIDSASVGWSGYYGWGNFISHKATSPWTCGSVIASRRRWWCFSRELFVKRISFVFFIAAMLCYFPCHSWVFMVIMQSDESRLLVNNEKRTKNKFLIVIRRTTSIWCHEGNQR